ncbi:MAG: phosphatidate cytidylyltransferase [Oscillospiraceae bacterium]|nr:phosphatidate cytidylyltransferase [Oscillospiraceae bacterium]
MKTKVIAGVIGTAVAILTLTFVHSPLPVVIIAVFAGTSAYELLKSLRVTSKTLYALTIASALAVPIVIAALRYDELSPVVLRFLPLFVILYVLSFFIIMLSRFNKIRWSHVFVAIIASTLIPLAISSFITIANFYPYIDGVRVSVPQAWTNFWLLFGLFCCWMTDTCAYFTGSFMKKKHKLAPVISPNKSWEGAIGGVALNAVINLIMWYIFYHFEMFGEFIPKWWLIPIISIPLSVLGILGDLCFSAMKRQVGIKDFGNIMPAHGGALDRLDSYMFVMPTLWAVLWLLYR